MTGGTGGIGFEVARALALAKARVILLSRKDEHGEDAMKEIKTSSADGPIPDITFVPCDLGNLKMVREVADRLREHEERLDIVSAPALPANYVPDRN